ncbi:hypothetical protein J6590_070944 [Homalodisca vitripennis]|nr:hypothetical protein J6590_070944 [Homalodisca vitripennis]
MKQVKATSEKDWLVKVSNLAESFPPRVTMGNYFQDKEIKPVDDGGEGWNRGSRVQTGLSARQWWVVAAVAAYRRRWVQRSRAVTYSRYYK